ncbi:MAG: hypothetical protein R3C01_17255 [Planctomycetaceae bacterium]
MKRSTPANFWTRKASAKSELPVEPAAGEGFLQHATGIVSEFYSIDLGNFGMGTSMRQVFGIRPGVLMAWPATLAAAYLHRIGGPGVATTSHWQSL